jgi:uncharacterized repeat protein (TIGR01451 family)
MTSSIQAYKSALIINSRFLRIMVIVLLSVFGVHNTAKSATDYPPNSLVIPMDVTHQNNGMWKAYGLVYNLLDNGVPVHWAINQSKSYNGTDFTATSVNLRTAANVGSWNYSGGPFIIHADDVANALPLIQAWWTKHANQPTVHQVLASFSSNVDMILRSAPRIANEAINSGITIGYYNAAGIPDLNGNPWSSSSPNILDQTAILNGALFTSGTCSSRNFDIFVTPHNGGYSYSLTDPNNPGTQTYAALDYFVMQGGGWMALCESIESNENAIAALYNNSQPGVRALFTAPVAGAGGFLTQTGIVKSNVGGIWTVNEPWLPLAQAVATINPQSLPGGSVRSWNRALQQYWPETELVAHFNDNGVIHDWAINGVAHNGTGAGKITYIGGHRHSTSLPYSGNAEAPYVRFFFNALFFNGAAVAKLTLAPSPATASQSTDTPVQLSLVNTGSSVATIPNNVRIDLPVGVTYISTTGTQPTSVTGGNGNPTIISWSSLPQVTANETALTVNVTVNFSTLGVNHLADFTARFGDVYGESFTINTCHTIEVTPVPLPIISKNPPSQGPFYRGQTLSWTIDYSNTGESALLNGLVEDILPVGFTFKSAFPAPSSVATMPDGTTRIRWNVGTLQANSPAQSITLQAYVGGSLGEYTNSVTLSGTDNAGNTFIASSSAIADIIEPDISLAKQVDITSTLVTTPGSILTYTVTPEYVGTSLLENVTITDAIPAYTSYVTNSANAGGDIGFIPIEKVDGEELNEAGNTVISRTAITATPSSSLVNGNITVVMTLTNNKGSAITNITPDLAETRGEATIISVTPASIATLANGGSANFTFVVQVEEVGEVIFEGTATGIFDSEEFTFETGYSNSVLVAEELTAADNLVTWRLGSNVAGVPGETISSGYTPGVYALAGANKKDFSKYGISSNAWASRAQPTNGIEKGGAITNAGGGRLYISEGNSKWFYQYDILTNTWTRLADASDNFNEGGGLQYLNVGGTEFIFAVLGNSNRFRRFNIASGTWAATNTLANIPENVKQGGAITSDGTNLYILRGDGKKDFWRYNVADNNYTNLANTPENVKWGGALTRVGSYIYAFRGDGKRDFWRYDIIANTWISMANAPGNVGEGGALTTDGTYIYALQGKTKAFWRYDIATNEWSALPNVNFPSNVGQGGALAYDGGVPAQGYFTSMIADRSLVSTGDQITLSFTITNNSGNTVNNIEPSAANLTGTNGATASYVSGPIPSTADLSNGQSATFTYVYTVTAGSSPGIITFDANASGTGNTNFPTAYSRGVIVTPPLIFQVQIDDAVDVPESVSQITNIASFTDQSAFRYGVNSNPAITNLLRPNLLINKNNDPTDMVFPDEEITYTLEITNDGTGDATNVIVTDAIPTYTTYVPGSANFDGTLNGSNVVWSIPIIEAGSSVILVFKVKTVTGLPIGTYEIPNLASVTADDYPVVQSNTVINQLSVQPELTIVKSQTSDSPKDNDQIVLPGNSITYTLAITNTSSTVMATGIMVTDVVPDYVSYVPNSCAGGTSCNEAGGVVSWNLGDLAVGNTVQLTFQVTVDSPNENGVTILNSAMLSADGLIPIQSNFVSYVIEATPELTVVKSADPVDGSNVEYDDLITYILVVTNIGDANTDNVSLTDFIPAGTEYVPNTTILNGNAVIESPGLIPVEGNMAIYSPGFGDDDSGTLVAGGDPATITFQVRVLDDLVDGFIIENFATVETPDTEPVNSNVVTHNVFVPDPAIALVKAGQYTGDIDKAVVGDQITYTYTVYNTGNVTLTEVLISEVQANFTGTGTLPTPAFVSASAGSSASTLLVGGVATFTATYLITLADINAGLVTNQALATGEAPDGTEVEDDSGTAIDNNTPTTTSLPQDPAIALIKTGTPNFGDDNTPQEEETISYAFTITNTGNVTLYNITIDDPKVSVTGGPIASLAPGASNNTTFTAIYTLTQDDINLGVFSNTATVNSTDPNGDPVSDSDTDTQTLDTEAGIALVKTGVFNDTNGDTFAQEGETITYTFVVTNTGNVTITDLVINDLTLGVINLAVVPSTLAPGQSGQVTFDYTLTQADVDAGVVTNTAVATGKDPKGNDVEDISGTAIDNDDPTITTLPQDPSIALVKTGVFNDENLDGYAQEDETITYTFVVTNTGNVTITDLVINDVKLGVTNLAVVPSTLAPGATGQVTFNYDLSQADVDAGVVTNTAVATGKDPKGNDVEDTSGTAIDNDDPTITTLPQNPAIALVKTGVFNDENSDTYAQEDETITYTFVVTNTGNVTITDLVINDLTLGVTNLAVVPSTLAPGQSGQVTFNYDLSQADVDAGVVTNTAVATGKDPKGNDVEDTSGTAIDNDDPTITTLPQNPKIALVKTGVFNDENLDGYAQEDETITYTFVVTNTGNVTITDLVINDVKLGVTNLAVVPSTLAPGATGQVTFNYDLSQADVDAGVVTNTAVATGKDPKGNDVEDVSGTAINNDDPTITTLPQDPSIALVKTGVFNDTNGDTFAQEGETITYTFVVTNTGNVTITDLVINDVKLGVTNLAVVPSTLAPGATGQVTFNYDLSQADVDAGVVTNTAIATGKDPKGNDVEDVSGTAINNDDPTITTLPQNPAIALVKTGVFNDENSDTYAQENETITYTFVVTNTGNVTITDLVINDVKLGVTNLAVVPSTLAPGATGQVTFNYDLSQLDVDAGVVTNTAVATGKDPKGNDVEDTSGTAIDNDDPTITTLPQNPKIALVKTGVFNDENLDGYAQEDETITYTFVVTNTGNVTITDLVINDVKLGVTNLAVVPSTLAPGATGQVTFNYDLSQADVDAGVVTNTAVATGKDPKGNDVEDVSGTAINNDDPTITTLPQDPSIALVKTGVFNDTNGDTFAQEGETITYTFVVTNTGNVTITDLVINDVKLGVTNLAVVPSTLAPGATGQVTFNYDLSQADVDAGVVTNTAIATGKDPKGNDVEDVSGTAINNDDPTITTLPQNPAIALVKTGVFNDTNGDTFAQENETITYTFVVTNTGNVTITDLVINDVKLGVTNLAVVPSTLAPGATGQVTFNYDLSQLDVDAGVVTNTAVATGKDPKGNDVEDTSGTAIDNDDPTITTLPQNPAIALVKTGVFNDENSDTYAQENETITYTFVVTNTGNVTITDLVINDVKLGVTNLAVVPSTLAPGATGQVTFNYDLSQLDVDAGVVTNTAVATGKDPKGNDVEDTSGTAIDNDDPTITTLPQDPSIALVKTGVFNDTNGDTFAQEGETITYTFVVTNTGNVTITDLVINDVKLGVTNLAVVPSTLAPGATGQVTFNYDLSQADVDAGVVTNTAIATGKDPKGNDVEDVSGTAINNDDPTITTLPQNPAIALVKTGVFNDTNGDTFAQENETITYTFVVTNTGNVTITDLVINDVKLGVTNLAVVPSTLAPGATGQVTFNYDLSQLDVDAGVVTNTAVATGKDPKGNDVEDTSGTAIDNDDPTITTLPQDPKLAVVKTATQINSGNPNPFVITQEGDVITYTIQVTNTGNVTITDIDVEDDLTGDSWFVAVLLPGESDTFTATYTTTLADMDAGVVTNTAVATGKDPNDDPVEASDDETVSSQLMPDIALIKTGAYQGNPQAALPDDEVLYSFRVKNTGNVTLTDVMVTDPLFTVVGGPVTLLPGEEDNTSFTGVYVITQDDINAGTITNTATATGTPPSGDDVTDLSDGNSFLTDNPTITTLPQNPEILVEKSANELSYSEVDQVIGYTIVVTNTGNVTITDIDVDDDLTGDTWFIASLAPTASQTFTTSYTITQDDLNNGSVVNTATAIGKDPNDEPVEDSDDATVTAQQDPAIALLKSGVFQDEDGDGFAQEGETITYTFLVENTGNVTVSGIVIDDTTIGVADLALVPGTLDPGEQGTVTFSYTVSQVDVDAGGVYNIALATGQDPEGEDVSDESEDPNPLTPDDPNYDPECPDCTFTPLPQNPAIALVKTGVFNDENSDTYAQENETITYTFVVTNTGNVTITDLVINDVKLGVTNLAVVPSTLAPGATGQVTFNYDLSQADVDAGVVTNTAVATGKDPKDNDVEDTSGTAIDNDDPTITTLPQDPKLAVVKTATQINSGNPNPFVITQEGDVITYTIQVTNTGNVTITDIDVEDDLTGDSWFVAVLLPGESDTFTATYTTTLADMDAGVVTNTAVATGKDPNDDPVEASDDETVSSQLMPGIALIKTGAYQGNPQAALPDDEVLYSFRVKNTGNVTLTDVVVTDPLFTVVGGPVTLLPGEEDNTSFTGVYVITQDDINAGTITNTATATGTPPSGDDVTDLSDGNSFLTDNPTITTLPQNPEILVEKSANELSYSEVDQVIGYTIVVTNTGNVTITDIDVDDDLTGDTWFIASLAPTASQTFTTSYTITQDDLNNGSVVNTATAIGKDPNDEPVEDSDDATVTAQQDPAIALLKSGVFQDEDGDGFAQEGETITYTFLVENTGNVTVSGIVIDDTTIGVADLALVPGTLDPGEQGTVTFSYTVSQVDVDAGGVYNIALATGQDPEGEDVSDESEDPNPLTPDDPNYDPECPDCTFTPLPQNPKIALVKTGVFNDENLDGYAQEDETITYTFVVTNTGNVTITDLVINDVKLGVTNLAVVPSTLAPGATGQVTFNYDLSQADVDAGVVTNTAVATGKDPKGNDVEDTSGTAIDNDDPTITTLPQDPKLAVVKTATQINSGNPNPFVITQEGDVITYTIQVTNTGNVTITDIDVEDDLTGDSWFVAVLLPGESDTFTATYTTTLADMDAGVVTNTAVATGKDPNDDPVEASDDETVSSQLMPDIALIKTGAYQGNPQAALPDDEVLYSFRVKNTGNVTLTDVVVTDPLFTVVGGPVTLLPGEEDNTSFTGVYVITQDDINAGTITNTATATGTPPSGDDVTDLSDGNSFLTDNPTITTLPQNPEILVEKSANELSYSEVDQVIGYTIVVTNTGNVTITDIDVDDDLTGDTWFIASLAPTASQTFTTSYTITQDDLNNGSVVNTATAIGKDPNDEPVEDSDDATVTAQQDPAIALLKSGVFQDEDGDGFAQEGETITYTFLVENTGNVTVSGIVIDDTTIGVADLALVPGTLDPGEQGTVTFSYTVSQVDVDAGGVYNIALATGQDPEGEDVSDESEDPNPLTPDDPNYDPECPDCTFTPLPQNPAIALVKTGVFNDENLDGYAQEDETITYTFVVTNTGNVTITDLVINDVKLGVTNLAVVPSTLAPGATGQVTFNYDLSQADVDAGVVTNTAVATGKDPKDNDVEDTSGTAIDNDDPTITTLPQDPKLAVVKTATQINSGNPNPFVITQEGDVITYTIQVTNTGNVTITDIDVEDDLTGDSWFVAVLLPGESDTFTATYTTTLADMDAGVVTNTAVATGKDPNDDPVEASDDETVSSQLMPGIALIKTGAYQGNPQAALPDDEVLYSFRVKNTGNVTLTDVVVTDPLFTVVGGPVTLLPGEEDNTSFTGVYVITQDDINAGTITNTATATGTPPSGDDVTDLSDGNSFLTDNPTITTLPQNPEILVEKSANELSYSEVDQVIGYTIVVTNTGNVTITDIDVDDDLTGDTWFIASLAPTASQTFTTSYTITQDDLNNGSVVNTATAIGKDPNDEPVEDSDDATVTAQQDPAIALLKSGIFQDEDGDGFAQEGETILYTFLVENTGNVTVSDIVIDDTSIGVADLALVPATLAPGESGTITFSYTVSQVDVDAGGVYNIALATGQDPEGEDVSDESEDPNPLTPDDPNYDPECPDCTFTPLPQNPAIALVKTGVFNDENLDGYAQEDETITYTFVVTNTGNVTITDLVINDVKLGVTNLVVVPSTLAPGESGQVTFNYDLSQADVDAGVVTNTAVATGKDPKGNDVEDTSGTTIDNDDPTITTLPQDPKLAVVKTATQINSGNPNPFVITQEGDVITYTIQVTNTGNVTITDIDVEDDLTGDSWFINMLLPGASQTFNTTYTVTQTDLNDSSILNTATATGQDPAGEPVEDSDTETVSSQSLPSLSIVKTANVTSGVVAGQTITYTYLVTNNGNVGLTNVFVSDVHNGTGNLSSITPASVATLAVGQSVSFSATYVVTPQDFANQVAITNLATATGTPPQGGTVTDTDDASVTPMVSSPSLSIVKTANVTSGVVAGQTITYTYLVTNDGDVGLTNVFVSDVHNGTGTLSSITPASVATLAVGQSVSFSATYVVTPQDFANQVAITNLATATGTPPQGGTVTDTDDASVTPMVASPSLSIVKTANVTSGVVAGQTITYTYLVTNDGDVGLTNVFVSDVHNGTGTLSSITPASVATLAVGQSVSFSATYVVTPQDFANQVAITNLATATGTPPQGGTVTDTDDASVTPMVASPSLSIVKTANVTSGVVAGQTITYTYLVTNNGNVGLTNVFVSDVHNGTGTLSSITPASVATLAVGQSVSFSATYVVTPQDFANQVAITNLATATGTPPQGGTVTDTDDASVTPMVASPSLSIVKTANVTSGVVAGQTITYTYVVTNNGNVGLTNVFVSDVHNGTGTLSSITPASVATLAVGQSVNFSATYVVTQQDVNNQVPSPTWQQLLVRRHRVAP